jgi:hypothetical protein
MEKSLVVSLILLSTLLALCIMSKTVSSNSRLGVHSERAIRNTCLRIYKDARVLRSTSHQDTLASMALSHNAEALSCARSAQALAHEYGIEEAQGLKDLIADLRDEQELSVRDLAFEMGDVD